jgi:hypothetical protein
MGSYKIIYSNYVHHRQKRRDCCQARAEIEPATSSLGKRLSIDNREHSVLVDLFLAIESSQFSFWTSTWRLTVFKRCSPRTASNVRGIPSNP